VRQIFPQAGPELTVVPAVTAGPLPPVIEKLAALYRNGQRSEGTQDGRWLRANMIASTDGAAELGGRSSALGGPADRMVFAVLRSLADVILVGAGTARAERYRPVDPAEVWSGLRAGKLPSPPIAVVSASLDLDACSRLLTSAPPHAQTIVLTAAAAPAGRVAALAGQARVVTAGQHHVDIGSAVSALAGLGYRHILAEGGPNLLGQLVETGLLDELCITTSPVLAGGGANRIVTSHHRDDRPAPAARLSLAHVLADSGFLFSRYIRAAG
jgi:riboflavin biosynthesis pyrimidine reductase